MSADPEAGEPPQNHPSFRPRILVVEHEHDLRQLTDAGYDVEIAENGAAAWRALQRSRDDLLFADQLLPKVSGAQLLKKIHAARLHVPVIMATGMAPAGEFALHTWLEPARNLRRPCSFDRLLDMIQNVLPQNSPEGDNYSQPEGRAWPPINRIRIADPAQVRDLVRGKLRGAARRRG